MSPSIWSRQERPSDESADVARRLCRRGHLRSLLMDVLAGLDLSARRCLVGLDGTLAGEKRPLPRAHELLLLRP